jgi:hypothetical protein
MYVTGVSPGALIETFHRVRIRQLAGKIAKFPETSRGIAEVIFFDSRHAVTSSHIAALCRYEIAEHVAEQYRQW